jgi:hypothetical protein
LPDGGDPTPALESNDDIALIRKLPEPLTYPWINDTSKKVTLQYTRRICEAANLSLKDIWKNRKILSFAALQTTELHEVEDSSKRLQIWLDNYVERGSFDDRTLVILRVLGGD